MMSKKVIKVILFFVIGFVLFGCINDIFIPRWNYPAFSGNVTDSLATFYAQEENIDDVVFLGASHSETAISPMQIYRETGITSYNLSTSGQPIEVSYFLLKEVLKTQTPKVIMLDCSCLYVSRPGSFWRYVMDSMPMSINKLEMIMQYGLLFDEENYFKHVISGIFPICQYHSRWTNVKSIWGNRDTNRNYISAGYWIWPNMGPFDGTIEDVDAQAELLRNNEIFWTHYYENGNYYENEVDSPIYSPLVDSDHEQWLKKIVDLCNENNIQLCLIKVPSVYDILVYTPVWTKQKSDEVKIIASKYNVVFYDLQYDTDLGLNYITDNSADIGHLNYKGAVKVSTELGRYLSETLQIEQRRNYAFDQNMEEYEKLEKIASLELISSFGEYIGFLMDNRKDFTICISVNDDISSIVDEELINCFQNLGLQSDFESKMIYGMAFMALIQGGDVEYEAISNRDCSYTKYIKDKSIQIVSSGHYSGTEALIVVDGINHSANVQGLNIVVLDNQSGQVIDSSYILKDDINKTVYHQEQMDNLANIWFEK